MQPVSEAGPGVTVCRSEIELSNTVTATATAAIADNLNQSVPPVTGTEAVAVAGINVAKLQPRQRP